MKLMLLAGVIITLLSSISSVHSRGRPRAKVDELEDESLLPDQDSRRYEAEDNVRKRKVSRNAPDNGPNAVHLAQKAAEEAKAAQAAQNLAGAQASRMVKKQLAEKALQAAKAAEAALSGKLTLISQIKDNLEEAQAIVSKDSQALAHQQQSLNVAIQVAQEATAQHKLLTQAVQLSLQQEKTAHKIAELAKLLYEEKCRNLSQSKSHLAELQEQFKRCENEYTATKEAAKSALESAKAAYGNTSRKKRLTRRRVRKKRFKNG